MEIKKKEKKIIQAQVQINNQPWQCYMGPLFFFKAMLY